MALAGVVACAEDPRGNSRARGKTSELAGAIGPMTASSPLSLLSVVIPARDEQDSIASTIEHPHIELHLRNVPHEIIAVDDGSRDKTWQFIRELRKQLL